MATPMAQRIVAIHESLAAAGVGHALGGAVALAFHTLRPRATNDIDLNVFVSGSRSAEVLRSLPPQVRWSSRHIRIAEVTGEVKLRWLREGPVDLFFSKDDYYRLVDRRKEQKPFAGAIIPVLSATDLTVFKAVFGRDKDWVDIGEMLRAGTVDLEEAVRWAEHLGGAVVRQNLEDAIIPGYTQRYEDGNLGP